MGAFLAAEGAVSPEGRRRQAGSASRDHEPTPADDNVGPGDALMVEGCAAVRPGTSRCGSAGSLGGVHRRGRTATSPALMQSRWRSNAALAAVGGFAGDVVAKTSVGCRASITPALL